MSITPLPSLPQNDSPEEKDKRIFQLSIARTKYNYMTSYLEGVPLSADVPKGEEFSLKYTEGVLLVVARLTENFKTNVLQLLEKEIIGDVDTDIFKEIQESYATLEKEMSVFHPEQDIKHLKSFMHSLSKLPVVIEGAVNIPKDLVRMVKGIKEVMEQVKVEGPTALLKSTLYELLNQSGKRDHLEASSIQDYRDLYQSFENPPLTVSIKNKP
jgi:arachidonate 15-lipoxygenase